jgi:hypothetical protein
MSLTVIYAIYLLASNIAAPIINEPRLSTGISLKVITGNCDRDRIQHWCVPADKAEVESTKEVKINSTEENS